jgi:hypothetical protein
LVTLLLPLVTAQKAYNQQQLHSAAYKQVTHTALHARVESLCFKQVAALLASLQKHCCGHIPANLTCIQHILLLLSCMLRHLAQLHHRRDLRPTKHCITLSCLLPLPICGCVIAPILGRAASSTKRRHGVKQAARLWCCVAAKQAAAARAAICKSTATEQPSSEAQ